MNSACGLFLLLGWGASGLAPWGLWLMGHEPPSHWAGSAWRPSAGQAGLVAGLWVGQAFGMFLLPGFGVSSSSPWVPGHPTSMCNAMGHLQFLEFFSVFLPPSSPFISLLCLLLCITIVVYCLLLLFSTELLTLCDGCLGWG